jgi:DNA polymerase delta subunit 3
MSILADTLTVTTDHWSDESYSGDSEPERVAAAPKQKVVKPEHKVEKPKTGGGGSSNSFGSGGGSRTSMGGGGSGGKSASKTAPAKGQSTLQGFFSKK